jgi:hypothetical protein
MVILAEPNADQANALFMAFEGRTENVASVEFGFS